MRCCRGEDSGEERVVKCTRSHGSAYTVAQAAAATVLLRPTQRTYISRNCLFPHPDPLRSLPGISRSPGPYFARYLSPPPPPPNTHTHTHKCCMTSSCSITTAGPHGTAGIPLPLPQGAPVMASALVCHLMEATAPPADPGAPGWASSEATDDSAVQATPAAAAAPQLHEAPPTPAWDPPACASDDSDEQLDDLEDILSLPQPSARPLAPNPWEDTPEVLLLLDRPWEEHDKVPLPTRPLPSTTAPLP